MTKPAPRKSDLPVRTASAVMMVAVAGAALWLGGLVWGAFVLIIGAGVLWEYARLVFAFEQRPFVRGLWLAGGLVYLGVACFTLLVMRGPFYGLLPILFTLGTVIAVDVGAYFAGRTFGGPKIAPRISPSKTWAGLGGGALAAAVAFGVFMARERGTLGCDGGAWHCTSNAGLVVEALAMGVIVAGIAQAGDFWQSWLKRRAGVKDSGTLIPGHGGLFDRVDGLIAVLFAVGVMSAISAMIA